MNPRNIAGAGFRVKVWRYTITAHQCSVDASSILRFCGKCSRHCRIEGKILTCSFNLCQQLSAALRRIMVSTCCHFPESHPGFFIWSWPPLPNSLGTGGIGVQPPPGPQTVDRHIDEEHVHVGIHVCAYVHSLAGWMDGWVAKLMDGWID